MHGEEDAMIVTDEGIIIRISLKNVGVYGRNTQGVKLINVSDGQSVAKVAIIDAEEEVSDDEVETEDHMETALGIDNSVIVFGLWRFSCQANKKNVPKKSNISTVHSVLLFCHIIEMKHVSKDVT